MEPLDLFSGPVPNRPFDATDEGLEKMLKSTPLFMQSLTEDVEDNVTLQALQSLIYEGTPEENAENFKNQGNECFRGGKTRYPDAIQYYTRALDEKCDNTTLNVACYINRAACNLELQNYRRVLNDCAKALALDPKCVKAYYRSAKACRFLENIDEAMDACQRGLDVESDNTALIKEKEAILGLKKNLEEKQRKKELREEMERVENQRVAEAIQEQGIRMITRPPIPDNPHKVHIDPETGHLKWPVFFLYPEYKESDFIAAFDETSTFDDHLNVMFDPSQPPAPWDKSGTYRPELLDVYFEAIPLSSAKGSTSANGARDTRLVKVGRRCTLGQALRHRSFTVINGMPTFVILSTVSPFKANFLARHTKN